LPAATIGRQQTNMPSPDIKDSSQGSSTLCTLK
jgi:hypothetical protein